MKQNRFTESQIVSILKQKATGAKVMDIYRRHSISDATFYNWKAKYGGME
jgi:putative transposase